ncbi:hypothetical protein [Kitasatospora mediocidica]|uniref:hypothetical protein n=1 Tax=Kitasatospora mediocidica TaxID=58352 RepID=UPI0005644F46|nr:hypothetical protein [Kitasatospora mediocidica]
MEAEIVALATSGATTVVGLMATELWTEARGRFAALFGRRSESVCEDLDLAREELLAAEDRAGATTAAEAEWGNRLRRALSADPAAAAQLRSLLDELAPHTAPQASMSVHNNISDGTFHGMVIMTGTSTVNNGQ